jgi:hypothetical protein
MNDTNCERFIRLQDVPALPWLPNGKPIHPSTVYRWCQRGVKGRKLRTARVGAALVTREDWLMDFCGLLDNKPPALTPTTRQRQRAIRQAERELSEAGI